MTASLARRWTAGGASLAAIVLLAGCAPGEVDLPNVKSETVTDALATLTEAGFEAEVSGADVNTDDLDQWTVRSVTLAEASRWT